MHLELCRDTINKPLSVVLLGIHAVIPIGLVVLTGDMGSALVFVFMTIAMVAAMVAFASCSCCNNKDKEACCEKTECCEAKCDTKCDAQCAEKQGCCEQKCDEAKCAACDKAAECTKKAGCEQKCGDQK